MNIRTRLLQFPAERIALIDKGNRYTFHHFIAMIDMIARDRFKSGRIISVIGKPNAYNVAKLMAAIDARAIIVPMEKMISPVVWKSDPLMYSHIRKSGNAGMVFFENGKPYVYDVTHDLKRFKIEEPEGWEPDLCMIGEHEIDGYYTPSQLDLLFTILLNGGTVIINE